MTSAWLTAHGIKRLILSGLRTEQCCETTTRYASDSGYAVDFVSEAMLTFPMTHPGSGRTYSTREIRERTELVLDGRFARIVTVAKVLAECAVADLPGPAEVLRIASQLPASDLPDGAPRFALSYVGPQASVATSIGLPLAGIAPLPEVLPADAVVVLVGVSSRVEAAARCVFDDASAHAVDWLRRVAGPSGAQLLCICSGALLAARAGLLDGRDCTTHHALCDALRLAAPRARVLENRLYVSDGTVSTSAGITAGIDMMLHLLAGWSGPRAACAVARYMVVYLRRGGADPQLSAWVSGRNHLHPALHRVQDALAADPVQPWSLDQMAQVACTSTRHLARLFHEHAGASPLDYLHRLRVAVARDLLAQSSLDMEAVAERAGFGSARHLRRVWRKFEEQAPSASRGAAVL